MSASNQPKSDRIRINEKGEVVIDDPKLAAVVQELSNEELDAVSGGAGNVGCNSGCDVAAN